MKAVVAAFNQKKALVEAFSVITNLRMQLFEALLQDPFASLGWFTPGQMFVLDEYCARWTQGHTIVPMTLCVAGPHVVAPKSPPVGGHSQMTLQH